MADKQLRTRISLRRDDVINFESSFIPLKGEVLFVNYDDSIRVKVGDGVTNFANLKYLDTKNNIVVWGYYFNGNFYTDSTYTEEIGREHEHIYIDVITNKIYVYDNTKYVSIDSMIPNATDQVAGILKLYNNRGQNIDGTMTQKVITDGIDEIRFAIDENDNECLVLNKPW